VTFCGRADAQTILPGDERFVLGVRAGVQALTYHEHLGNVDSDYNSTGPAIGISGSFKLIDRLRLNLDYLGSFIQEDTETWRNLGTIAGFTVNQQNETKVTFHALDLDLSYSVVKTPQVEWAVSAGWHYYIEDFTRSNFRFLVASLTIPTRISPVTEDVTGQGLKIGTTVGFRAGPKWLIGAGLAGYYLYDVKADNSALGTINSDGLALRWRVSADYIVNSTVTVGVGYDGHFISVERANGSRATLPKNETLANTLSATLGIRF